MSVTIRIEFDIDGEKDTETAELDNPTDTARWLIANLGGWCIDDDVSIFIDDKEIWPDS